MIAIDEKCLGAERLQHCFVERSAGTRVRTLNGYVSKHNPEGTAERNTPCQPAVPRLGESPQLSALR
jgi:hypothetical protein